MNKQYISVFFLCQVLQLIYVVLHYTIFRAMLLETVVTISIIVLQKNIKRCCIYINSSVTLESNLVGPTCGGHVWGPRAGHVWGPRAGHVWGPRAGSTCGAHWWVLFHKDFITSQR